MRAALLCLVACSGAPHAVRVAEAPPAPPPLDARPVDAVPELDPDLHREPRPKLLAIDWDHVHLGSDADALALWQQIAPTGGDWQDRMYEVPVALYKPLAVALLRQGNFACPRSEPGRCGTSVAAEGEPAIDATLDDPCLRRTLALWSLDQLEATDFAPIRDALRALVATPPPESQLVDTILEKDRANPDQDARLDLIARAWQAGQQAIAGDKLGDLDEAHFVAAVQKFHIGAALQVLDATADRAVYLGAIDDAKLDAPTRAQAIADLVDAAPSTLAPDLRAALFTAAKVADCEVAGTAARALVHYHALGPPRPPATMRTLCVVAGWELTPFSRESSALSDTPSPLGALVPAHGLEAAEVARDASDPSAAPVREARLVPQQGLAFGALGEQLDGADVSPIGELLAAFARCKGATCTAPDYVFRFTLRGGRLMRLEMDDRPACSN